MSKLRKHVPLTAIVVATVCGCSIQRAQTATTAQAQMIGMSKGDVLACMGVPGDKAIEGSVEVWSYAAGNGRTDSFSSSTSNTLASVNAQAQSTRVGNTKYATGSAIGSSQTNSFGVGSSRARFCTVSVVMTNGQVSRVNYSGPTGGLITKGEQCAYAVENCLR
jgi:hypothetical protein